MPLKQLFYCSANIGCSDRTHIDISNQIGNERAAETK